MQLMSRVDVVSNLRFDCSRIFPPVQLRKWLHGIEKHKAFTSPRWELFSLGSIVQVLLCQLPNRFPILVACVGVLRDSYPDVAVLSRRLRCRCDASRLRIDSRGGRWRVGGCGRV